MTTEAEGFVIEGHHRGPDGRRVDCRCATKDGHAGVVTINGQAFDLDQGALFLVSTISGNATIRQLKREMPKLDGEDFRNLAKNDQEIRDFWTNLAKGK